jgi:hypothetical protein
MKSTFNEKSLILSELDNTCCALIADLQVQGFVFDVIGSTLTVCELEYPLYTVKSEAKEIYRNIQKTLDLI